MTDPRTAGDAGAPETGGAKGDLQQTHSNVYDRRMSMIEPSPARHGWTFLTNHAHVLLALSRNPDLRQRDISYVVGITPGAVQRILDDLEREGYLRREKVGRRNHYEITADRPLRHPLEQDHTVSELLDLLESQSSAPTSS